MGLAEFNLAFSQDSTLNTRLWVGNEIGVPVAVLNVTPPGPAGESYILALQYWALLGYLNSPESQAIATGISEPVLASAECDRMLSAVTTSGGSGVNTMTMEPGADLRDSGAFNVAFDPQFLDGEPLAVVGSPAVVMQLSVLIARFGSVAIIAPVIRLLRTFAVGTRVRWDQLPQWARTVLLSLGVVAGTEIIIDDPLGIIPFVGGDTPSIFPGITSGMGQVTIVGQWVANGVIFYRLSDGKLAVQNKHGRWKVWRPKKPIVLMPGGAGNLRTLLRADRLLDKQAKQIAKMLNRRAPRSKRAPSSSQKTIVLAADGSQIANV